MADPRLLNPAEKVKASQMNEKLTEVIDNKGRWEKRIDLEEDYLFYMSPELANLKYAIHAYLFVYAVDQPDSIQVVGSKTKIRLSFCTSWCEPKN